MPKYRVTLIVDRNFGDMLRRLPIGEPVWIIDTPTNHNVIEKLWQDSERQDYLTGVTSFKAEDNVLPEEIVLDMLDSVYDHHGPFSHDPPMDALHIVGAEKIPEICNWFREEGFTQVLGTDQDYEIRKPESEPVDGEGPDMAGAKSGPSS